MTRGGQRLSFVVVEPNNQFNGVIKGDVMYIGADTLESGKFAGTLVHEYTHFEEGSKEYKKLIKYLAEDSSLFVEARNNVVGTDAGYGLDAEALASVQDKITKGEQLTADEALAYGTYQTEVAAHMSEAMLGSEAFIDKLVKNDGSLVEKLFERFKRLKESLSSIGDAEARAELSRIRKAERLYLKAAEKAGNKELARRLRGYIDEDKEAKSQTSGNLDAEGVDSEGEIQYNRKTKDPDLYTASDDFMREVPYGDRSAFARSLANKTTGMVEGEIRTVYIFSTSKIYSFRADGYMHGEIKKALNLSEYNKQYFEDLKNEYNEIDKDTENAYGWTEVFQGEQRRGRSDNDVFESRGRSITDDTLSKNTSERNGTRNIEREWTDTRTKEEYDEIIRKLRELYGMDTKQKSEVQYSRKKAPDTEHADGQKENALESESAVQYERKAEIDYNNAKINFDVIDLVSKVKSKQHKDNDDVELISPSREVLEELKKKSPVSIFLDIKLLWRRGK